jgi:hypothetical protein
VGMVAEAQASVAHCNSHRAVYPLYTSITKEPCIAGFFFECRVPSSGQVGFTSSSNDRLKTSPLKRSALLYHARF